MVARSPLYEVQLDIYIARRKRMHTVNDPAGEPVYHDPFIMNVMDWLADKDIKVARFTDDESHYIVSFERAPNPETPNSETDHG